jgi:hypothetical protein
MLETCSAGQLEHLPARSSWQLPAGTEASSQRRRSLAVSRRQPLPRPINVAVEYSTMIRATMVYTREFQGQLWREKRNVFQVLSAMSYLIVQ